MVLRFVLENCRKSAKSVYKVSLTYVYKLSNIIMITLSLYEKIFYIGNRRTRSLRGS
jgi:hypothetical protein